MGFLSLNIYYVNETAHPRISSATFFNPNSLTKIDIIPLMFASAELLSQFPFHYSKNNNQLIFILSLQFSRMSMLYVIGLKLDI